MINKETAYKKISAFIELFVAQIDSFKNTNYNETLTRNDFIDPFFKAAGWNLNNHEGCA
jgi:adenine-specific DNA-methyltransferase